MSRRTDRVNELLREEIGDLLLRQVRDPVVNQAMVSVTEITVSPDLRYATVYVSSLKAPDQKALLASLGRAAPFLHRELRSRLRTMRRVPELRFEWDVSLERGAHLTALIRQNAPPPEDAAP